MSRCVGTTSRSAWSTSRCACPRNSAISISSRLGRACPTRCRAMRKLAMARAVEMKATLKPGLTHRLTYRVPADKTVPHLYPESPMFRAMPAVFATGFMVGLFEWACTELLNMHLDPGEGSLGIHVDFTHTAATP